MNERDIEMVKNFWRLGRSAEDTSQVLLLPLTDVEKIYQQCETHRQTLLRTLSRLRAAVLILFCLLPDVSRAQSISPLTVECGGKKCNGQFTVTNAGITPIVAVVSAQQLQFQDGKPQLSPLPADIRLELARTSARIGARQAQTFDYKLTCDRKPCAVHFDVVVTGPHTSEGVQVAVHLSVHSVYYCEQKKNCRASIVGGKGR